MYLSRSHNLWWTIFLIKIKWKSFFSLLGSMKHLHQFNPSFSKPHQATNNNTVYGKFYFESTKQFCHTKTINVKLFTHTKIIWMTANYYLPTRIHHQSIFSSIKVIEIFKLLNVSTICYFPPFDIITFVCSFWFETWNIASNCSPFRREREKKPQTNQ